MRVLVADDDLAVRSSLERALRLEGYDVTLAADGRETLERVVSSPPDALVLDVRMPALDGLEVCRRMRAPTSVALPPSSWAATSGPG
jgi:two-component system response regulator MprA